MANVNVQGVHFNTAIKISVQTEVKLRFSDREGGMSLFPASKSSQYMKVIPTEFYSSTHSHIALPYSQIMAETLTRCQYHPL
jgi:hypothetical protein